MICTREAAELEPPPAADLSRATWMAVGVAVLGAACRLMVTA
jgi:hypothetical protein